MSEGPSPAETERVKALVYKICVLFQQEGRMDGEAGPIVSTALTEIVARWLCSVEEADREEQAERLIKWAFQMVPQIEAAATKHTQ